MLSEQYNDIHDYDTVTKRMILFALNIFSLSSHLIVYTQYTLVHNHQQHRCIIYSENANVKNYTLARKQRKLSLSIRQKNFQHTSDFSFPSASAAWITKRGATFYSSGIIAKHSIEAARMKTHPARWGFGSFISRIEM